VWLYGLSYGAIAAADGFALWLPALASMLVIAGSSELLFVGVVAAGGSPVAVALAGLLVNSRHKRASVIALRDRGATYDY
jgi:predicted branched-subunit amino acid permease